MLLSIQGHMSAGLLPQYVARCDAGIQKVHDNTLSNTQNIMCLLLL